MKIEKYKPSIVTSRRSFLKASISLSILGISFPFSSKLSATNLSNEKLVKLNVLSYKGYLYHSVLECFMLGDGRPYDSYSMQFFTPDSWSTSGLAGPNRYSYSLDPINNSDHSGHLSTAATVGVVLGGLFLLIGLGYFSYSLLLIAQMGWHVSTVLGSVSAFIGLASSTVSIASSALLDSDPVVSAKLGWAALGLGILSILTGIGTAGASYLQARNAYRSVAPTIQPDHLRFSDGFKIRNLFPAGRPAVVQAHGRSHNFSVWVKFNGRRAVNGNELGKIINPHINQSNSIDLVVCYGAQGGRFSSAQLLANKTNLATTGYFGKVSVINRAASSSRVFQPLEGINKLISNLGGKTASHLVRSSIFDSGLTYRAPMHVAQMSSDLTLRFT